MIDANSEMLFRVQGLLARLGRFDDANVLIVGDLMLDEYLMGDVERISPEAPVPVVLVAKTDMRVGGAGNVAVNIQSLGGRAHIIGVIGDDQAGAKVCASLSASAIETHLVTVEGKLSTVKTRILARQQQMLRVDREDTVPLEASVVAVILQAVEAALPNTAAIILSDYGKGVVSAQFMDGLRSLLTKFPAIPVLVDPKPQNIALYDHVTLLTPNTKETREMTNLPMGSPAEIAVAGKALMERLHCPHLVATLGAEGVAVFSAQNEVWHIPTSARHVFDVTGAGDTIIAVTGLALAAQAPLVEACLIANFAAGLVVGEVGSATVTRQQLMAAIVQHGDALVARWR